MLWIPRSRRVSRVFRRGVIGFSLLLSCSGAQLWAQTTIYTWTDEKGVRHYSNSMAPSRDYGEVEQMVTPSHAATPASEFGVSENIPLVILNNNASQKFVRATLEGERTTQEVLMLVDTGAQITLIDEDLAEELHLEHVQDALLSGVTGTAQGWIGRLPRLRLGTETVNDLYVMVGPLPGRFLLGMDVIERLELSVGPRSLHRSK
jgi:predicted aspartyl protease